jgi:hypothetical protein
VQRLRWLPASLRAVFGQLLWACTDPGALVTTLPPLPQTFNEAGVPVSVWTSTLKRTIQTANFLPYPKLRWKALDEIHAGMFRCRGWCLPVIGLQRTSGAGMLQAHLQRRSDHASDSFSPSTPASGGGSCCA